MPLPQQTTMNWTGPSTSATTPQGVQPGTFVNNGNDFGESIFGQSSAPGQVYFGGQAGSADQMMGRYQSMGSTEHNAHAAQTGDRGMDAYGQQMKGIGADQDQARRWNQEAANAQFGAIANLQNQAAGRGPSQAGAQLQQGLEQGINANMAVANSARGQAGLANAQKNALGQNAQMAGQSANQAAQLRAQEMQSAQQQLMQATNQAQNQYGAQQQGYSSLGMQGAGAVQGNELANAQFQQQQNALNQQGRLGFEQLGFNAQAQNMQAQMNNQNNAYQMNMSNAANAGRTAGGIISAAGSAMMMSDQRAKDNIRDAGPGLDEALNNIHGYQYNYKPGLGQSPETQTGIMAQDLASTDAGSKLVGQHPSGAMGVKIPEATGFALASVAHLNQKINNLQRGGVYGDMQFQEPGGGQAAWTIREEPDFLLAKNDRTGELRKIMTQSLSKDEHEQAVNRPHGAGPIDGRRVPAVGDAQYGDAQFGGISPTLAQASARVTPPAPVGTFDAMADKMSKAPKGDGEKKPEDAAGVPAAPAPGAESAGGALPPPVGQQLNAAANIPPPQQQSGGGVGPALDYAGANGASAPAPIVTQQGAPAAAPGATPPPAMGTPQDPNVPPVMFGAGVPPAPPPGTPPPINPNMQFGAVPGRM